MSKYELFEKISVRLCRLEDEGYEWREKYFVAAKAEYIHYIDDIKGRGERILRCIHKDAVRPCLPDFKPFQPLMVVSVNHQYLRLFHSFGNDHILRCFPQNISDWTSMLPVAWDTYRLPTKKELIDNNINPEGWGYTE